MDALQKTSPFSGSSRIVENKVAIFCNDSSRYFADLIAENLGLTVGKVTTRNFGDGETYYRVDMNSRTDLVGYDAIFVSSTSTDADLLGLVRIGTLLAESGTHRRIFVIPFFGYSTMERAVLPGEVVTCKVNCRILSSIPNTGSGNVFLFLDLHVGGILQYFEGALASLNYINLFLSLFYFFFFFLYFPLFIARGKAFAVSPRIRSKI
eukprot:TRINITY_DN2967_c0_g1_i3.p1 TRINITY_DN2967_c0_g1~~TRINITY_DN2967_c0_g1_i3.p1  ORF type:complete len:208 (-),score=39.68 TRINITY_DN2967_c0_g1_i3:875-1498(-)